MVERDQAALPVRGIYPADRDASSITKALAGSPDTLAALAPFLSQVMNATTLDLATKEVVVLRVSAANRCAYCVPTHEVAARRAGLGEDAVAALAAPGPPDERLEPRHRVLARYCDQVVADAGAVSDGLLAEMREHFEDHELVELTVLAGAITTLNYVASVARLPLDPWTLEAR
jgi:AhpD family alkylhydroperoxidase